VELFYRIKKTLKEDFQAFLPGGKYPFTKETLLLLILYAGFFIFAGMLFLYPRYISCSIQKYIPQEKRISTPGTTEI